MRKMPLLCPAALAVFAIIMDSNESRECIETRSNRRAAGCRTDDLVFLLCG